MRAIDLPFDWVREYDEKGMLYYYDRHTHRTSAQHPCIKKFRKIYYDFLE